jgi:hypothetical protein
MVPGPGAAPCLGQPLVPGPIEEPAPDHNPTVLDSQLAAQAPCPLALALRPPRGWNVRLPASGTRTPRVGWNPRACLSKATEGQWPAHWLPALSLLIRVIFHSEVIGCFFDRINRHCGQMHVVIFRITSLTAQTKVIEHSDQFRSPLR